jgi:hypothetical protein
LNVHKGEWKWLAAFFVLIALNTAALEGADVVATSSYLERLGLAGIPLLWIADMLVILLSSVLYSLVADRFHRATLLRWLLMGFALALLLIRTLISYGLSDAVSYTLLYIVVDQQLILFPLAFWALASDMCNVAASKRLFPLIAAGGLVGNVVGNWFAGQSAAIFARRGLPNYDLLMGCSLFFFIGLGVVAVAFRRVDPPAKREVEEKINLRDTWRTGMEFVRNVPLFRYLALVLFFGEITLTIIEFHFLAQTTEAYADPIRFQALYGNLKAVLTGFSLLVQFFIAGRLLEKVGLKNAFFFFPVTLLIGSAMSAALHEFFSAVSTRLGARVVLETFDRPSRQSVQGLIPDARRGRVGTFLNSYVYGVGTIAGCLLLGLFILLGRAGVLDPVAVVVIYEIVGGLMAVVALFFAFRLRAVYDTSLWNPWLARRKRQGAKIELDL